MSGTQPVALYAVKVPPGGILVPAVPDAAAMFRVTMAAIDPDAVPEYEDEAHANKAPRATLRIVRPPPGLDYEDSDEEDDEDDEDEDSDDEANGGPSDPARKKRAMLEAALRDMDEGIGEADEDDDDEEDIDLAAAISKLVKGKGKATDDDESDSDDEDLELDEVIVCTLDPERNFQQTLDFVVGEGERVFFKVTGTHTVYLTGNYVTPLEDTYGSDEESDDEDDEDEYDLSPDEDELAALVGDDDESDELDDLADPRVMEIDTDEEQSITQSKKEKKEKKDKKDKKSNKRPADDSEDEEVNLDDMIAKTLKTAEPATNGEPKLSKKQLKKLKKNNGEAAEAAKASPAGSKSDKKVQFAKELEQGPTPTKAAEKKTDGTTGTLGVKQVQGVTVDDKKLGKGKPVKNGDRIEMRYIGRLENGKVFDSNKNGKPFSFKVGSGEVIKGWEVGIPGMAVGGERRLTIPAQLAYGRKALPGIPANSKLIFDVKLLNIK
ncbi:FK506-binding protein 4 [Arthroderma uncinatum]|uniref:FK506-binding protein 4 n=1 Tax=Arthroderma uncinatum TaxID=74035 RepID=UPI00144A517A|nr:FK506-binding protein 4 [Arthroderma uncinatum]KAF3480406.1 FK506-binding protein 4 [Arthroderma uncinatum]